MDAFSYSYFSGANVCLKINNLILDCAGISYKLLSSKQPIYSHHSARYDMLSTSRQIVQGSFVINYSTADYLFSLITSSEEYNNNKQITSRYVADEVRHNGFYLQYNNVRSFDIEIDFGRDNLTILKTCYITSRAQTINIDDNVLLEEYSFIAREIRIKQSEQVSKLTSDMEKEKITILKPPVTPKFEASKPKVLAVASETTPVEKKKETNTAVTETVTKKIDPKTTEVVKKEEVKTASGTTIPVERSIDKKTTKVKFNGSRGQVIELATQNLMAMQKLIDDAKEKHPDSTDKQNEYIFNTFKKMSGGIPPSSRFIPKDMNDQDEKNKYYADGRYFIETLIKNTSEMKRIPFDDFNIDSSPRALKGFFDVEKIKKEKDVSQGDYYALTNTLALTSVMMLPISTGELGEYSFRILNPEMQEPTYTMKNKDMSIHKNFANQYSEVPDTLFFPFIQSNSDGDDADAFKVSSKTRNNFTIHRIQGELNRPNELLDSTFSNYSSNNLSIDDSIKNWKKFSKNQRLTKKIMNKGKGYDISNVELSNFEAMSNDRYVGHRFVPLYYEHSNYYDSLGVFGFTDESVEFFKQRDQLKNEDKTIVNGDYPFQITGKYDSYKENPLEFFNGIQHTYNGSNGFTMYRFKNDLEKNMKIYETTSPE